jgi:hypothetical protein
VSTDLRKLYQEKALAIFLTSPEVIASTRFQVSAREYFPSVTMRTVYETVIDYMDTTGGAPPTIPILNDLLAHRDPAKAELYRGLVHRLRTQVLEKDEEKHVSFFIEKLRSEYSKQCLQKAISAALSSLERDDVFGAQQALYAEMPVVGGDTFVAGSIGDDVHKTIREMEYRRQHPEIYSGCRIGFSNVDKYTGGHYRKEFGVVVGGTGVGKSLVLGAVAVNVSRGGKKVLLVTIENDRRSYMNRLYANISGVKFESFKRDCLSKDELNRWHHRMSCLPKSFCLDVVEFPRGCSAHDIWMYMRATGKEYDYLVVDQISNMLPNNPDKYKADSWQSYGAIALELKRLADIAYNGKGIPVLTASQAAGGTVDKKELNTDDVAMSKQIIRHAHFALYIVRSEDAYLMGASKYRDAFIKSFPVWPDFEVWSIGEGPTFKDASGNSQSGAAPGSYVPKPVGGFNDAIPDGVDPLTGIVAGSQTVVEDLAATKTVEEIAATIKYDPVTGEILDDDSELSVTAEAMHFEVDASGKFVDYDESKGVVAVSAEAEEKKMEALLAEPEGISEEDLFK